MTGVDQVDVVVVGAGVVGCAVAATLARQGREVLVLEREAREGTGVSSRNSGVIHSGLYYPPASLKAETCLRGQELLYSWCARHRVDHARLGKLVVARSSEEEAALQALADNTSAAGARDCVLVGAGAVRAREPGLPGVRAALWCPNTGIVDVHGLCGSLRAEAEAHGAVFGVHARVDGAEIAGAAVTLRTTRGPVVAGRIVNAAGLHADELAALLGAASPRIHPCRGDYFRLRTPVRYRHLIYPVRARGAAGLGVHLTLDLAGAYRLGPDVTYVEARDDFGPAAHKLAAFHRAACALLGPIGEDQLSYEGCGIRPKLRGPDEPAERDFAVFTSPGCVHLVGIESPGLTAALALAEKVAALV
ncbi:NAD(P)/FAD-dependent oxidoreductase [Nannocystis bainbridge]|uniref:NAD(P)/FAD-dependent oxidoreductase n=1 Tax=Nannocystis bainbridge TaxID=2995303 RepID=A0ABT5DWL0_9BACT|nr:NAD(P)/FAD-dependent oxidoreductase [Nannocystis bainbridge]MDC0718001.1 NAD(P)/FAD-dependent oxidoreductase [Nannocystis bainbridge]